MMDKVEHKVNDTLHQLFDTMTKELQQGSGLVFRAILWLDINISKCNPNESDVAKDVNEQCDQDPTTQLENSNFGHNYDFELSRFYQRKLKHKTNTILDVKNSNNRCFIYAVAAFLYQEKFNTMNKKENANSYTELIKNNFNLEGIGFPTPFQDIRKFVKQNEHLDININVYTVKEDELHLVCSNIADEKNPGSKNVNLLALFPKSNKEKVEKEINLQNAHFVLINKIETLFGTKDSSNRKRSKAMCHLCHMTFTSAKSEKFLHHKKFCTNVWNQYQDLPEKKYKLKFDESDFDKQYLNEYIIFFDFECILRSTKPNMSCEKCRSVCKCVEDQKRFTEIDQSHVPVLFNYHIIDNMNQIIETDTRYCPQGNAAEEFVRLMLDNQKRYVDEMIGKRKDSIRLTDEQKKLILKKQNNRCRHCRRKVKWEYHDLVVDHSHYSNVIHGISHNEWFGSF